MEQSVVVVLGPSRYAVPMDAVVEVGRVPSLTRVPGLPAWAAGVANWRGRVLAVVDLRPVLGEPMTPPDRRSRVVLVSRGAIELGLLVDAVEGAGELAEPDGPVLAHLSPGATGLLTGQVTDGRGPCGVLDLDAVLALADELPRPRRAG